MNQSASGQLPGTLDTVEMDKEPREAVGSKVVVEINNIIEVHNPRAVLYSKHQRRHRLGCR